MSQHDPFTPKKSLGQNFLVNSSIAQRIVASCDLTPDDTVIEIGPGKGALTHLLSRNTQKVFAIEKDDHLAKQLQNEFDGSNVEIVHADILDYPFDKLPNNITVVGNLPYNIATPIIKKVLNHRNKFNAFYMTVQFEYGQRIAAHPGNKKYGSLSCFVQYYAGAKMLFKIKNSAFKPIPKVQSCFLKLDFSQEPKVHAKDEQLLFAMIRACFAQRRKTIMNSLSTIIHRESIKGLLQALEIDPKSRAENISLEKYVQLLNLAIQEEKKGRQIFVR